MALDRNHYVGTVLSGGYKIERFVGSGAFAYVYYATAPNGDGCAVKVQYNLVADARTRFSREIKVLRELPPNDYLVKYYADGVTPEGYPYLIMEYVDGITLKAALKKRPIWPEKETCELFLQLCEAFGGLHQLGVVHRDVKPENIMLTKKNQVKLMDLGLIKDAQGLCKLLESEDIMEGKDFAENLDKGVLAGTPEYMAPEQFSDPSLADESKSKTDTWTDVYSLGLIFYEMLAGKKLFVFAPPQTGKQSDYAKALLAFLAKRTNQRDEEIIPIPKVSFELWTVIARALHCDPTKRQLNASELAEDIRRFLTTGEGVIDMDAEKTSAIDIRALDIALRSNDVPSVPPPPAPPSPAPSQELFAGNAAETAKPHNIPGLPQIPGMPGYVDPNAGDDGEGNFWLWVILILLVIVIIFGLVAILFIFP